MAHNQVLSRLKVNKSQNISWSKNISEISEMSSIKTGNKNHTNPELV